VQVSSNLNWDGLLAFVGLVDSDNATGILRQTAPGVPEVLLSPAELSFPVQLVGTFSTQTVTVTNVGDATLTIFSIVISGNGDFAETTNCGTTLPPGATCKLHVNFFAGVKGIQRGSITLNDNAIPNEQTIPLTGIGTVVDPPHGVLTFGAQQVGTKSVPLKLKLTNIGTGPLHFSGISINGQDANDF